MHYQYVSFCFGSLNMVSAHHLFTCKKIEAVVLVHFLWRRWVTPSDQSCNGPSTNIITNINRLKKAPFPCWMKFAVSCHFSFGSSSPVRSVSAPAVEPFPRPFGSSEEDASRWGKGLPDVSSEDGHVLALPTLSPWEGAGFGVSGPQLRQAMERPSGRQQCPADEDAVCVLSSPAWSFFVSENAPFHIHTTVWKCL